MIGGFFGLMSCPISYDWAALLVRVAVGLALITWGIKKIANFKNFTGTHQPPSIFKMGPFSAKAGFIAAMCTENGVAICLFLGFCTRLAVLFGIVNFIVAFSRTKGPYLTSAASLYLLMMIVIFFIGSGQYSVDYLLMLAFGS